MCALVNNQDDIVRGMFALHEPKMNVLISRQISTATKTYIEIVIFYTYAWHAGKHNLLLTMKVT